MEILPVGEIIRAARIAKGLTQEELGKLVGVQKSAIAKYENGRVVNIKMGKIVKIAQVLGLNGNELIESGQVTAKRIRASATPERLCEAMRKAGKKQIDISRETGIDKGSISSYLSGRYVPKQEAVHKLAVALDVSEMWLLGYDVPMSRVSSQKDSGVISDVAARLRTDSDFLYAVKWIYSLDKKKLECLLSLIR